MASMPWGVVLLMLIAVGLYFGLFQGALACWRLSLEGALILLLVLIGADFVTLSIHTGSQTVQIHVGSILLVLLSCLLWFFQSGRHRPQWLWAGSICALLTGLLILAADRFWLGDWFQIYWILPFLLGLTAAILTRNVAGLLWLTIFPMFIGQLFASLYWYLQNGFWLTVGSSQVFDMALLAAGFACLLVAAMQFFALRRMV